MGGPAQQGRPQFTSNWQLPLFFRELGGCRLVVCCFLLSSFLEKAVTEEGCTATAIKVEVTVGVCESDFHFSTALTATRATLSVTGKFC